MTPTEVATRGQELYEAKIRPTVETESNVGKIVVIDVESGDYEIDSVGFAASRRVRARHPSALLYAIRIGFDSVEGLGFGPEPVRH